VAPSPYVTLTASVLDATGLTYTGTVTVASASGSLQVLRFTMTSGALTQLSVTQACAHGITTMTTAASATLGSTTFDAVSLAVTAGGTATTFTPAAPPTAPFPAAITLQDVTLSATSLSGATLTMPAFSTQPATC
jgi:hypothetical protein